MKKQKRATDPITIHEFQAAWNAAASLREAAAALGISERTLTTYAKSLRDDGVALKEFARGRPRKIAARKPKK